MTFLFGVFYDPTDPISTHTGCFIKNGNFKIEGWWGKNRSSTCKLSSRKMLDCWKMLNILILIAFYGTIVVILAWGQTVSVPPHCAQKPNTPLSNEEQVWDVRGIGIREPEKDLKWRMQFLLHFGDSFQSNVTFAGHWNSLGQQCRTSQIHGLWKRNAPTGRAVPPRMSPESASNFRGSWSLFQSYFKRLYHLRFDASLSFI